ncbi:MAG: hypothetical protein VYC42_04105 [Pseudomonadota bacterium]|nr:hypothetical protein [Pseudomonadota bacterium]
MSEPHPSGARPPMTAIEYVNVQGTLCPYCRSSQIEGEAVDIDGGHATQPMRCNDCGRDWIDRYQLTGFVESGC